MSFPQGFICPCSKADRLINCQLQDVEMIDNARHTCEYSPVLIIDPQKSMLDVDVAASLLELPKAHNVGLEGRN
jgi:hypothetical protein